MNLQTNNAFARGAYALALGLVLLIPDGILFHQNLHGTISPLGRHILLLLTISIGLIGIIFNYGILKLAQKHEAVFLERATWLVLIEVIFVATVYSLTAISSEVRGIAIARTIISSVTYVAIALQGLGFAKLSTYYGQIALDIRNMQSPQLHQ